MPKVRALLAGFGGQGVLFAGKTIATAGLIAGCEVAWMPSYGPEMRGGTANCSVTISDELIGSPLVTKPDALIVMNQPSYDKFIDDVQTAGIVVVDADMVPNRAPREDVAVCAIPAQQLAEEAGLAGLSNIVLIGKLWALTHFCPREVLDMAIEKVVPPRKADLIELNKQALEIGIRA